MFIPFAFQGPQGGGPPPAGIVTDSLRLYVNANDTNSYPGTGATWFDLSGDGRDLSLDSSPTFTTGTPNFFDFTDGTDAATYEPGGTLSSVTSQGDQYTVCMFFAYEASTGNFRTLMRDVTSGGSADDFWMVNTGTNNLGTYDGSFRSLGVNVSTEIPSYTTQFNYQVLTVDDGGAGDDVNFYLNDASGSALGSNNNPLRREGPGVFGNQQTGGQPGAKIAAIIVYDKVLSTAEIGQNYDALKTEMGL